MRCIHPVFRVAYWTSVVLQQLSRLLRLGFGSTLKIPAPMVVEADPFLKVTLLSPWGRRSMLAALLFSMAQGGSDSFVTGGSHLLSVWWWPNNSEEEGKNPANLTVPRGTDTAHLKQLVVLYSVVFSLTPECLHGIDEMLCYCCNYVLELFLQPLFLSTVSLSEYSEAILF